MGASILIQEASRFEEVAALQLKTILRQVPDPRGKQGQDYMLWSILSLIIVSLLCGRRGMKAAFLLGRSLSRRQKAELGFTRDDAWRSPRDPRPRLAAAREARFPALRARAPDDRRPEPARK